MAAAIQLRGDSTGMICVGCAIQTGREAGWRLLALAATAMAELDGGGADRRGRAADRAGLGLRFNDEGPDGLIDRKALGKAPMLTLARRGRWRVWWRRAPSPGATEWCAGG